jgi:hypothetical protein
MSCYDNHQFPSLRVKKELFTHQLPHPSLEIQIAWYTNPFALDRIVGRGCDGAHMSIIVMSNMQRTTAISDTVDSDFSA